VRRILPTFVLVIGLTAPPAGAADGFAARLAAEIGQARAEMGLGELADDPELDAVAQGRADAMARDGWFALLSPAGTGVVQDLDARHYAFLLVTEKLVRTVRAPAEIVGGWRLEPAKQADTVFHPEVTRLGVGIATRGGERLIDIVLAQPAAPGTAPGASAVGISDPEAAKAALEELIAQRRKAKQRAPLRRDPLLVAAAQRHAEDLVAALEKGQGPESISTLSDVITELERTRKGSTDTLATSHDAFQRRDIAAQAGDRRGNVPGLESVLVVDAPTAGVALQTIESSSGTADLLDPSLATIGIGLAVGTPANGGRLAWVVAMRRR